MTKNKPFCEEIKSFRNSIGLSQENFAANLCSLRHYKRIEQGLSEPSNYLLSLFSFKYGIDFNSIYSFCIQSTQCIEYDNMSALNEALQNHNSKMVSTVLSQFEANLNKCDINIKMCYYYGMAVTHPSFNEGIHYAIKGLQLECPTFNGDVSTISSLPIFSHIGLNLVNYIAVLHKQNDLLEISNSLYEYLACSMESHLSRMIEYNQFSPFYCDFYPKTIYNYSNLLLSRGEYQKSLDIVESSIATLNHFGVSTNMHILLWCKVKSLYKLNQFDKSIEIFTILKSLCILTNNTAYLSQIGDVIVSEYPLLATA